MSTRKAGGPSRSGRRRAAPHVQRESDAIEEGRRAYMARDFDRARALWQPLAEAGNAEAQAWIGSLYANGDGVEADAAAGMDWLADLGEVVYVDRYGNAMTGIRASTLPTGAVLKVADVSVHQARTFSDVGPGEAIWYENSSGLVEVAMNQANAARVMGLRIGTPVLAVAVT